MDNFRMQENLCKDENGTITYPDILSNIGHLQVKGDRNLKRKIDSVIKKLFHTSPKRDAGGKQYTYYGLSLINKTQFDSVSVLSDIAKTYKEEQIKLEPAQDSTIKCAIWSEEGGTRLVTINCSQQDIIVTNKYFSPIEALGGSYTGKADFCNKITAIMTARKCQQNSAKCEKVFHVKRQSKEQPICSACQVYNRQRKHLLKQEAIKQGKQSVNEDLEAVSPKFLLHVSNQIENSTRGQPVYEPG